MHGIKLLARWWAYWGGRLVDRSRQGLPIHFWPVGEPVAAPSEEIELTTRITARITAYLCGQQEFGFPTVGGLGPLASSSGLVYGRDDVRPWHHRIIHSVKSAQKKQHLRDQTETRS